MDLLAPVVHQLPTFAGPVYYGPMPNVVALKYLSELRVEIVWNLAKELTQLATEEQENFQVIWTPITDFNIPENPREFLSDLSKTTRAILSGKKVFVHCFGGRGRTGMALAAILVKINNWTPEKALKFAHEQSGGPEIEQQKQFIIKLLT